MPEIVINKKAYPLRFGMGFLRSIDASVTKEIEPGVPYPIGFQYKISELLDGYVYALADIILAANATEEPRLTQDVLDAYLEDETTDIDKLTSDVLGFLKSSNVTGKTVREMETAVALVKEMMRGKRA